MALFLHILIAIGSVFYTGYVFFYPSKTKLRITYISVILTVISGSYLVFLKPTHMMQACFEGLLYIGVMLFGIIAVRNKLAATDK